MIEMIEDISNSIVPPPLSLTDCLFDGQIDPIRYLFYQCRYSDLSYSQNICTAITKKRKSAVPILSIYKKKQKRSVKRHKLLVREEDSILRELRSKDMLWYRL